MKADTSPLWPRWATPNFFAPREEPSPCPPSGGAHPSPRTFQPPHPTSQRALSELQGLSYLLIGAEGTSSAATSSSDLIASPNASASISRRADRSPCPRNLVRSLRPILSRTPESH